MQPSVPAVEEVVAQLQALPKRNAASLRRIRRAISQQVEQQEARVVLDWAVDLLQSREAGSHVVAYEVVLNHPQGLSLVRSADVERLGRTIRSWGEVDTFACYVAGRAWRMGRIPDRQVARWARSPDRWWRRAALVSTVPLNVRAQGGEGDAKRTLAICSLLIADRDPMVVKALSWALRELAVRDRASVAAFLDRHEDGLARQVVREVRSKLDTGRKNRPRRSAPTRS